MMLDESLIVAVAFFTFLFFVLFYRPVGRSISGALDARAARIEQELSDAIRLREEAQVMLSEYEKKYREIEKESEAILAKAKESADAMRQEASRDIKAMVDVRIAQAHAKIARAEQQALQGVQKHAIDVALKTAQHIMTKSMRKQVDEKLIRLAAKDSGRIIH